MNFNTINMNNARDTLLNIEEGLGVMLSSETFDSEVVRSYKTTLDSIKDFIANHTEEFFDADVDPFSLNDDAIRIQALIEDLDVREPDSSSLQEVFDDHAYQSPFDDRQYTPPSLSDDDFIQVPHLQDFQNYSDDESIPAHLLAGSSYRPYGHPRSSSPDELDPDTLLAIAAANNEFYHDGGGIPAHLLAGSSHQPYALPRSASPDELDNDALLAIAAVDDEPEAKPVDGETAAAIAELEEKEARAERRYLVQHQEFSYQQTMQTDLNNRWFRTFETEKKAKLNEILQTTSPNSIKRFKELRSLFKEIQAHLKIHSEEHRFRGKELVFTRENTRELINSILSAYVESYQQLSLQAGLEKPEYEKNDRLGKLEDMIGIGNLDEVNKAFAELNNEEQTELATRLRYSSVVFRPLPGGKKVSFTDWKFNIQYNPNATMTALNAMKSQSDLATHIVHSENQESAPASSSFVEAEEVEAEPAPQKGLQNLSMLLDAVKGGDSAAIDAAFTGLDKEEQKSLATALGFRPTVLVHPQTPFTKWRTREGSYNADKTIEALNKLLSDYTESYQQVSHQARLEKPEYEMSDRLGTLKVMVGIGNLDGVNKAFAELNNEEQTELARLLGYSNAVFHPLPGGKETSFTDWKFNIQYNPEATIAALNAMKSQNDFASHILYSENQGKIENKITTMLLYVNPKAVLRAPTSSSFVEAEEVEAEQAPQKNLQNFSRLQDAVKERDEAAINAAFTSLDKEEQKSLVAELGFKPTVLLPPQTPFTKWRTREGTYNADKTIEALNKLLGVSSSDEVTLEDDSARPEFDEDGFPISYNSGFDDEDGFPS